jgi:hypothetical protein
MGFSFVEAPVVEKRVHGENMSSDLGRALFQAAFVQLEFLDWSRQRGIDASFLDTDPGAIIDNVLRKARETQCVEGIRQILTLAEQRRITTRLVECSHRYKWLSPASARIDLRIRAGWRRMAQLFVNHE